MLWIHRRSLRPSSTWPRGRRAARRSFRSQRPSPTPPWTQRIFSPTTQPRGNLDARKEPKKKHIFWYSIILFFLANRRQSQKLSFETTSWAAGQMHSATSRRSWAQKSLPSVLGTPRRNLSGFKPFCKTCFWSLHKSSQVAFKIYKKGKNGSFICTSETVSGIHLPVLMVPPHQPNSVRHGDLER